MEKNLEIVTEAAQFLEKEYINGILLAVQYSIQRRACIPETSLTQTEIEF